MKRYYSLTESFDDLQSDVQEDIVEELKLKYSGFKDTSKFWNDSDIIDFVKDTPDLPELKIKKVSPEAMFKQFKNRTISKKVIDKYKKMIQSGTEFDPIIVSGIKFLDGGHRVQAYYELGKKSMPAIDIKPLLDYNWGEEIKKAYE
jgi:hypothetical protein